VHGSAAASTFGGKPLLSRPAWHPLLSSAAEGDSGIDLSHIPHGVGPLREPQIHDYDTTTPTLYPQDTNCRSCYYTFEPAEAKQPTREPLTRPDPKPITIVCLRTAEPGSTREIGSEL
jgi:hypothetical protein